MREIVLIKYYNVCFYLAFQRGKDEINKQCLVKRIESGAATNMKEPDGVMLIRFRLLQNSNIEKISL